MKHEGLDYPQDTGQSAKEFLKELEEYKKEGEESQKRVYDIMKKASAFEYEMEFPGGKSLIIRDESGKVVFFTNNPKIDFEPWFDERGFRRGNKAFETGKGVLEDAG